MVIRPPLPSAPLPEPIPAFLTRLLLDDAEAFFRCPPTRAGTGRYLDSLTELAQVVSGLVELATDAFVDELKLA